MFSGRFDASILADLIALHLAVLPFFQRAVGTLRKPSFVETENTLFAAGGRLVAMGNQTGNSPRAVILASHDDHRVPPVHLF